MPWLNVLLVFDFGNSFHWFNCRRLHFMQRNKNQTRLGQLYNTTIWSSGANCTEIQQTLNEGLSKANSWFLCVKFVHLCVKGNTASYCCTQGLGDLSEFLFRLPRGIWWGLNGHLDKSPSVSGGGPQGEAADWCIKRGSPLDVRLYNYNLVPRAFSLKNGWGGKRRYVKS